jgi:Protein of unknown function (DUF2817)
MDQADPYFPGSYQASRERLLASARAWSKHIPVTIDSRAIAARGPSGESLALDWVQLGPRHGGRQAKKVLVLSSGTHGIEGFCGAGVQHAMLEHYLKGGLSLSADGLKPIPALHEWPDDFALVICHAINPYGFSWLRRVNENNVDLNRNSVEQFDTAKIHPDYEALFDLINPADLEPEAEAQRWQAIEAFIGTKGERAFQQAVAEGQYKYPRGVQFGGHETQASIKHLHALSAEYLTQAKQVLWVDYHTGLGDLGACELITGYPKADPAFQYGHEVWGEAVKSTESGDSLSTKLNGLIDQGLRPLFGAHTRFFFVSAEYGTYPVTRMLRAMRSDNWLHHYANNTHPLWPSVKAEVLESFRPNQAVWRQRVLKEAETHLGRAFKVLFDH